MKKLVSILLALVFCVSLLSVTAVAFADEDVKSTAKADLVGSWTDDNGSRIKFTEKEFSGTIKYKEVSSSESSSTVTHSDSVSGKYTYVGGVFEVTKDENDTKANLLEVTFNKNQGKLTFVKLKEHQDEDDGDQEATEPDQTQEEGEESNVVYTAELTRHTISVNDELFLDRDEVKNVDKVQGAVEDFQFDYAWLAEEDTVRNIFPGINYILKYGDWTAELNAQGALEIVWKQNDVEKTATLTRTDGEATEDNKLVGTWESQDLAGKSVKLVFDSTMKVAVTRDGLSVDNVTYALEGDKATFTTGDVAKSYAVVTDSDKILVQYATPTVDYKDFANWNTVEIGTDINVIGTTSSTSRLGWWVFRFVVRDSAGTVLTNTQGDEIRSARIDIWFGDGSAPAYRDNDGLTSDMISVRDNGLTVGETYTIKTNLRYIDNGTVTVKYSVYKWDTKTNNWTAEPILVKGESVAEGYEDCITASGVITPLASDVLPDNKPVYRIVYSLVDDQLYQSETTTLDLFVKKAASTDVSSTDVWKIILYVVAGLSAAGIVVVLCIKPKEQQTADARLSNKGNTHTANEPTADTVEAEVDNDTGNETNE